MRKFILLTLIFFINAGTYASAIYFRHFLPENGLADPAVISICQDSLGRIWFGTENGISIYDGTSFLSIKPGEDINLKGSKIYDLICSKTGDVFIRTNEGIGLYNSKTGKIYTIYNSSPGAIYMKNGQVYILDNSKLYEWDFNDSKVKLKKTYPFSNISRYIQTATGYTFIVCNEGLMCGKNDTDFKKIINNNDIYSIYEAKDSTIWVGSREDGLFRIKNNKIKIYNAENSSSIGFHSNDVREITQDREGNLWFGTFNGLYMYSYNDNKFTSYLRSDIKGSLTHSSIYSVFMDNSGILWIGTYYGGVNYVDISHNPFIFYPAAENSSSLSHPVVGQMTEDKNGMLWICTEGGGLNMLNPKTGKIKQFRSNKFPYALPHTNLKWLEYDKERNTLYIGSTFKGLYSYDITNNNFKNIIPGTGKEKALAFINIVIRNKDNFFLSTREGVYIYNEQKKQIRLLKQAENSDFTPMCKDNKNMLWVGGEKIYSYNIENLEQEDSYILEDNGKSYRPLRLFCLNSKDIYASTYGHGIFRFDRKNNKFIRIYNNTSSHSSNRYCYRIAESPKGNLIVLGEKGINIISKDGELLQTFLIGKNIPLTAIVRDCGLTVASDGSIYAGGINGLLAFKEEELSRRGLSSQLYFSELYINRKRIIPDDGSEILKQTLPYSDKIEIPYNVDRIGIKFTSKDNNPDFNPTDYEYRLIGYDDNWYQAGGNMISYTNLHSGKYRLELRSREYKGIKHIITNTLDIRVLSPWYFRWQAIILYIIITGFIIFYLLRSAKLKAAAAEEIKHERLEKKKLIEINEAKLKFFTSISHEFKTPLTIMTGQLEMMLQNYKLAPTVYNKLLKIMQQAKSLGYLISDLIEFRKYEQDKVILHIKKLNINEFITSLYDRFSDMASQKKILFEVKLLETDTTLWADSIQLERTIMNLLSNAFKFTESGGSVILKAGEDENNIFIHVKDTGKGIKKEEITKIFDRFYRSNTEENTGSGIGLSLVKEIIDMHHGLINLKSIEGQGSEFIITMKKGLEHFNGDSRCIIETNTKATFEKKIQFIPENVELSEDTENKTVATITTEKDNIIIVEDNRELLELLNELLCPLYSVYKATNGKEALEIVKQVTPSLILSDIMMPIMSGTELCAAIKSDINLCHIPVVLLTALDMPKQELEGLLMGADDYISKPFDAKLLVARCNNIIMSRKKLLQKASQRVEKDITMLATNQLDKEFLDKFSLILENEISNSDLGNDVIASMLNMSRASFYNKFKSLTGETPNEYINNIRLSRASEMLLKDITMPIVDIAESLGFSSPNYFSRKFKEKYNLSPAAYRQEKS